VNPAGSVETVLPRSLAIPLGARERRGVLVAGDFVVVAALTTVALRLGALRSGWAWSAGFVAAHWVWMALLGGLWVALAWINGLYDLRRAPDRYAAAVLSVKVSAQILLVWAVAYFVPPPWTLVRHVVVFFAAMAAVVMPLWRQVYAAVLSRPAFRRRVLIVGAGDAGRATVATIRSAAPHDFEIAGFVDDAPALQGRVVDDVPVIANRANLVAQARRLGVTEAILAITRNLHGGLFAALMDLREQGTVITPFPLFYEATTGRVPVEHIGDHWAVALPLDPQLGRGLYPALRRLLDIAVGAVGLLALALILPVAGVLIRLTSPGPVFYRQVRVGRGGRPFALFKLRTMVTDAERDGPMWASTDDERVTSAGRWLRRTRLDELPQCWNVLRGEMSLVGPRPERPEFVSRLAQAIPFYRARHAVKPGLTGWATIQQGYASSEADALVKLQYDLYYIKHQSLFLDLYILLRTAAQIVRLAGR
jgi:exopolysaccharide biosynthesis polyprenyl glycosylphosphotransferase